MRRQLEGVTSASPEPEEGRKRMPPADPELCKAWELLKQLTTRDGWVVEDRALPELAQEFGMSKRIARHALVKQLHERGYLKVASDMTGRHQSYRVYE